MNFTSDYFSNAQKVIMGVIKDVRPELLANFGKIDTQTKEDKSIVTNLDKDIEIKLKKALNSFDSSVGLMGEEFGHEGSDKSYWLIDPIDGTEQFVRGLPGCRNILTFVDSDEAQFALIYRFSTDDLFIAQKDKPSTKNGKPVKLSERSLDRAWLEFSVNMQLEDGYKLYQKIRPAIAGITVHRDFLEIVEGKLEGMIVYKSAGSVWDYAPRALLIEGAGGRVTNVRSNRYDINERSMIAVTPHIYDPLEALAKEALLDA